MDVVTEVFLIERISHKDKIDWLKRIISSQIGVLDVNVNPVNKLMKVEYDSRVITPETMRMLIRSVGSELIINQEKIHAKLKQKKRFKRDIIFFILSVVLFLASFLTLNFVWWPIATGITGLISLTFLIIVLKEQRRNF